MDGFLEADQQHRWLFNLVCNSVRKGLRISYFFPEQGADRSVRDFDLM
jgi:hypothetical protein